MKIREINDNVESTSIQRRYFYELFRKYHIGTKTEKNKLIKIIQEEKRKEKKT